MIKRVSDYESFKAVDNFEIVEVIGIPTTNTKEVSFTLAKIKLGLKTTNHWHFIENRGNQDLLIWCICTPAFSSKETILE